MKKLLAVFTILPLVANGLVALHHHEVEAKTSLFVKCIPCKDSADNNHHHEQDCVHQGCHAFLTSVLDSSQPCPNIYQKTERFVLTTSLQNQIVLDLPQRIRDPPLI